MCSDVLAESRTTLVMCVYTYTHQCTYRYMKYTCLFIYYIYVCIYTYTCMEDLDFVRRTCIEGWDAAAG